MAENKYWRVRFYSTEEDPRPIKFPPPGPFWVSGYTGDYKAILIAWLPKKSDLKEFWPEAEVDEWDDPTPITFSGRFPKPEWWKP